MLQEIVAWVDEQGWVRMGWAGLGGVGPVIWG